jgi:hypothetical protein
MSGDLPFLKVPNKVIMPLFAAYNPFTPDTLAHFSLYTYFSLSFEAGLA